MPEALMSELSLEELVAAWSAGDQAALADPYPLYKRLRQEAPRLKFGNQTILSTADDINAVSLDRVIFKGGDDAPRWRMPDHVPEEERESRQRFVDLMRRQLDQLEAEQHKRMRGLVQKAFTPRTVEGRQSLVQNLIDGLLEGRQDRSEIELVREFSFQLPLMVVCAMLDLPLEDRFQIREWGEIRAAGRPGAFMEKTALAPDSQQQAAFELDDYLRQHVRQRRKERANSDSLLSELIAAEAAGDKLNEDELIGTMTILMFAGHETTTNQIGNTIVALMRNRDQWELLLKNPELVPNAVEEALRYDAAVQTNGRWATKDHEVEGTGMAFAKDDEITIVYASANRDESKYENPDVFDVGRPNIRHWAFGVGRHFCLGSSLTRMEIAMALQTFLQRFPDMEISQEPVFRANTTLRGIEALHLSLGQDRG